MAGSDTVNRIKNVDSLDWACDTTALLERALEKRADSELLSDLLDYLRDLCKYSIVKPNPVVFEGDVIHERVGTPEQLIGQFLGIDPKQYSLDQTRFYENMDSCQALVNGTRCGRRTHDESLACSEHNVFAANNCRMIISRVGRKTHATCSCQKWQTTEKNNVGALNKFHEQHLKNFKKRSITKSLPAYGVKANRVKGREITRRSMRDLSSVERHYIVANFFNWLAITHDAVILDRHNQTTAPVSDLCEELAEGYFNCIPA